MSVCQKSESVGVCTSPRLHGGRGKKPVIIGEYTGRWVHMLTHMWLARALHIYSVWGARGGHTEVDGGRRCVKLKQPYDMWGGIPTRRRKP